MTAKEMFEDLRHAKRQIQSKQMKLACMRETAGDVRSVSLTGMPHSPSPSYSAIPAIVEGLEELEEEIRLDKIAFAEKKQKVLDTIALLDNISEQEILIKREVMGMKWDTVSKELSYSKRWMFSLYKKALEELSLILKNTAV